ncbi:hypothetical protein [Thalassobaculum sp.]|uniref:hypothetical protein n=1 Tax=Thalassobaculum sp. TaxID=2022740 RepID=UPI003B5AC3D5
MALISCEECGREVSDKAVACPGCGAPIARPQTAPTVAPGIVKYDRAADTFTGGMAGVVKLAMRAVQALDWKLTDANESLGLVTFETGMSWGSWSGVSCSLNIEETSPNIFKVSGTGKQNVRGGQIAAFNIGNEAQKKALKAIEKMKELSR